jgi:hypothetical protein
MTYFFRSPRLWGAGIVAVAGVMTVAIGISGCHSNSSPADSTKSGETVAMVNDDAITSADFYDAMQHYVPVKSREDMMSPTLGQPVGQSVLWELIQNRVLLQVATQKNVPVTKDEVDERYNYLKLVEEKSKTTKQFDEYLADEGYTENTYKDEQVKPLVARLNLVANGQTVTDDEAQKFYAFNVQKNTGKYSFPQRAHIERIIVSSKTVADAAALDAKQSHSFTNFLAQNMARPTTGGADASDLPLWLVLDVKSRDLPAGVIKALKNAKTDDVITVQDQAPGYYWVVRVVDMEPAYQIDFNSIKDLVKQDAMAQKGMSSSSVTALQQSMMTTLQSASIKIIPRQYQGLETELKAHAAAAPPQAMPAPAPGKPAKR